MPVPEADLNALAAALAGLRPTPATLDRDRLMFELGRTAAAREHRAGWRRRVWPSIAAGLLAIVVGEGTLLARRPEPEVRFVGRMMPAPPTAPPPAPLAITDASTTPGASVHLAIDLGASRHARLAGLIARYGLDGLPTTTFGPPPVAASAPPTDVAPRPASPMGRRDLEALIRQNLETGSSS